MSLDCVRCNHENARRLTSKVSKKDASIGCAIACDKSVAKPPAWE